MGLFSSAEKQSEITVKIYDNDEVFIDFLLLSPKLLGDNKSYALTLNYLYYLDRVLFNISNDLASLVLTDFTEFIDSSIHTLQTVKQDKQWATKNKNIRFSNENYDWKFLKSDKDNELFAGRAGLYLDGQRLYCNTDFSRTNKIEQYACISLNAIASYKRKNDSIDDFSFFTIALGEQLKFYNYRKPGLRDLGSAVIYGLSSANSLLQ